MVCLVTILCIQELGPKVHVAPQPPDWGPVPPPPALLSININLPLDQIRF